MVDGVPFEPDGFDAERDLRNLIVASTGTVEVTSDDLEPVRLLDDRGSPDNSVGGFVRNLVACDYSPATCRSYVLSLLRWRRFLVAVDVAWDRAERRDVRDFVLWMRGADNAQRHHSRPGAPAPGTINTVTGKRALSHGYAPATINHALAAIRMYYEYHLETGLGPLVNPVPAQRGRGGDRPGSHRSPMAPAERPARAAYRQRNPGLPLRALPDAVFDQFFVSLANNRDRAIVALAVSSGARASELLGLRLEDLDIGRQLVALEGKGHHELEWVPASPDAFMWLAAYLAEIVGHRPPGDTRLWWTLRGPPRPLTYWALRQVLARANEQLGSNIAFHDLRHTYAQRLMADPNLFITDVQRLMRHRSINTTQIYARAGIDALVTKMKEHYARPEPSAPRRDPAYDPAAMAVLFPELA
jgi:site-specific recombinase XerD